MPDTKPGEHRTRFEVVGEVIHDPTVQKARKGLVSRIYLKVVEEGWRAKEEVVSGMVFCR